LVKIPSTIDTHLNIIETTRGETEKGAEAPPGSISAKDKKGSGTIEVKSGGNRRAARRKVETYQI
jgi:hypothetical protein